MMDNIELAVGMEENQDTTTRGGRGRSRRIRDEADNVVEKKIAVSKEVDTVAVDRVDHPDDIATAASSSTLHVETMPKIPTTPTTPSSYSGKLEKVVCYFGTMNETTKTSPKTELKILETARLTRLVMQDSSFESKLTTADDNMVVEVETANEGDNETTMWHRIVGSLGRAVRIRINWFPKMCSCLESVPTLVPTNCAAARNASYERLSTGPTLFQFYEMKERERRRGADNPNLIFNNERQAELQFYNDDLTWTDVCVEKDLRMLDLCELLKVKTNAKGREWSIVETWPELGIERTPEDHEDILAVHREMEMFASHHDRKFFFRKDFLKYEVFIEPKQFFPPEIAAFPNDEDQAATGDIDGALRRYLAQDNSECPQVFNLVWIRDESSSTWKKIYMLLEGRKLYINKKSSFSGVKYLRSRLMTSKTSLSAKKGSSRHRSVSPDPTTNLPSTSTASSSTPNKSSGRFQHQNLGAIPKRPLENEQTILLARLSDYQIYRIPDAKTHFNAPFEWGICLRPSDNAEAEDTESGFPGLKVIVFNSEKSRACWLTAMRLSKYGKQLRENYRAFKNKQCEQNTSGSPKEQYSSYNLPNESLRSRVAMDFTGSVGRIVDDPKEAKDIAKNEGIIWRRTWRPFSRAPPGVPTVRLHGLDRGVHVVQPWFHSGLNRDVATAIIRDHGTVDGVFLVRESKSNPGAYVVTYKFNGKVFHAQIQPMFDERKVCWLYSLDKGATKFYDLLQLIEFYQLNPGSLHTKLTHYVQNTVKVGKKRQEDGCASPSPPNAKNSNKKKSSKSDCPKSSSGI